MNNPVYHFLKTFEGKELSDLPSPVTVWLKSRLVSIEEGNAVVEYKVRKEMTNPLGTLQGGIFTAMMDDALGVAAYSLGKDRLFTSVNFSVDFLESAFEGDIIRITAGVVREGRNIVNMNIRAESRNGKLLATATSNLVAKTLDTSKFPDYKGLNINI